MARKTTRKQDETHNFEKNLEELEKIVELMEAGDITLEDALQHFERGVKLTRACQDALKNAEQRVNILMENNENSTLQDFDPEKRD